VKGQLEVIEAVYEVLQKHSVPNYERLILSDDSGNEIGKCLSTISFISVAERHPEEVIWLSSRIKGRLCSLRFHAENQFELTII
jgi:hypothetical protein